MDIKEQIETLKTLQRIETESVALQTTLDGIEDRVTSLDAGIGDFENRFQTQETALEALKKECRGLEMDEKDLSSRMKKAKSRLATVKSNREYQALQKAIEEMRREQSHFEDAILTRMESIDASKKALVTLKEEYAAFQEQVKSEKAAIQTEAAQAKQKLDELNKSRIQVAETADPSLINRFMRVRQRISTLAVAPVNQAVCQGCNMNIPPQMFNELQRCDSLRNCPHCQRIIYWEKPLEEDGQE